MEASGIAVKQRVISTKKENLPVKVAGDAEIYLGTCCVLQQDLGAPKEAPRKDASGCRRCSVQEKKLEKEVVVLKCSYLSFALRTAFSTQNSGTGRMYI
jgi:hypothetical protein